jgi:hypothetical protein
MFNRITTQAAALALSAVLTVAMLAGMDHLALQERASAAQPMAGNSTPVQVVVITGHRIRG